MAPPERIPLLTAILGEPSHGSGYPVESIEHSILYVFGDEYSSGGMQRVVTTVERLNRKRADGARRIRIHAVGFSVVLDDPAGMGISGIRFATLMRVLCQKNGGTFVQFIPSIGARND